MSDGFKSSGVIILGTSKPLVKEAEASRDRKKRSAAEVVRDRFDELVKSKSNRLHPPSAAELISEAFTLFCDPTTDQGADPQARFDERFGFFLKLGSRYRESRNRNELSRQEQLLHLLQSVLLEPLVLWDALAAQEACPFVLSENGDFQLQSPFSSDYKVQAFLADQREKIQMIIQRLWVESLSPCDGRKRSLKFPSAEGFEIASDDMELK